MVSTRFKLVEFAIDQKLDNEAFKVLGDVKSIFNRMCTILQDYKS